MSTVRMTTHMATVGGDDTLRVLLVEDNPADLRLATEALREPASPEFHITPKPRLSDALRELEEEVFDAVLLDLSLPDSQGLDTVTRLQAAAPEVPIVVLTGTDDEDFGSLAVAAGVQTYLVKGQVTGASLRRALRYAIERYRLESRLQQAARTEAVGRVREDIAPGLNDLLTVIAGFTQLLLARDANTRSERDLKTIASATERAAALVRQLCLVPAR